MAIYRDATRVNLYTGDKKMKKVYSGDVKVYSSGCIVTYHVDTDVTYTEEIEDGEYVHHPISFTPQKSRFRFLGWRYDTAAVSGVWTDTNNPPIVGKDITSETCDVYAVFTANATVTYSANGGSGSNVMDITPIYYNNGNQTQAKFTARPSNLFSRTGYAFVNWTFSSVGTVSAGMSLSLALGSYTATANWFANEVIVATIPAGQKSDSSQHYFTMPDGYTKLKLSGSLYWKEDTDNKNWGCILIDTLEVSQMGTKGLQAIVKADQGGTCKTAAIYTRSFAPGSHYWVPGGGAAVTCWDVNIVATI